MSAIATVSKGSKPFELIVSYPFYDLIQQCLKHGIEIVAVRCDSIISATVYFASETDLLAAHIIK